MPADTPRAEVTAMMRTFTTGLGVTCEHCHVEGNRASDEMPAKKTARVMMQMTTHINETLATGLGKAAADVTKVQCVTCHRGDAIPKNPPPPAPPAAAPSNTAAPGR